MTIVAWIYFSLWTLKQDDMIFFLVNNHCCLHFSFYHEQVTATCHSSDFFLGYLNNWPFLYSAIIQAIEGGNSAPQKYIAPPYIYLQIFFQTIFHVEISKIIAYQ